MDSVKVKSFSHFVDEIETLNTFSVSNSVIFRGQATQGDLLPGIARKNPKKNTEKIEKLILKQLHLMGSSYIDKVDEDSLELIVLAQHYGLKTRLLDWTSNPSVALWFACADYRPGDVFVYALEADQLMVEADIYVNDPFKQKQTRIFQPRLNSDRIIAQHGWFTLHRYSTASKKFVSLDKNKEANKFLTEYSIPNDKREEILHSLNRHGINKKTLFPGLEGLCHFLNWHHIEQ